MADQNRKTKFCVYCMRIIDISETSCPHCHKSNADYRAELYALKPGAVLKDRYLIGAVLGAGGFGITYI